MAAQYNLQSNEVVVLKEENVMNGGTWAGYTDQLLLTNLHLVLIKKGMFGGSKGIRMFPLSQIKRYNDRAQANLGKARNGTDVLEVYFVDGEEQFGFQTGGKKKINEWCAKINEVVTGRAAPDAPSSNRALPGSAMVAGVLKDTVGVFKSRLGGAAGAAAPVEVATKCRACGAPLSGIQGRTATCEYCNSAQQL